MEYGIERYTTEARRLWGVLDGHLADNEYMHNDYSIADMACYPWIVPHQRQRQNLDEFPQLKRWFETIRARPATERAYALAKEINPTPVVTEEAKRVLFGQDAKTVGPG